MPVALVPAAIDAVIIAILAAIAIWALAPVLRALLQAMAQVPFGGAYLAGRAVAIADATVQSLAGWAAAQISPLTTLVVAADQRLAAWRGQVVRGVHASAVAVWRINFLRLPALQKLLADYAFALYQSALTYAGTLYHQAIEYAFALYESALTYAGTLYHQALDFATGLYQQALAYAFALYESALTYAGQLYQQALTYAGQLYGQAIAYAQAVLAQALGFAEDAFGRAIDFERFLYGEAIGFAQRVGVAANEYAQALFRAGVAYTDASTAYVLTRVLRLERSKCQQFCDPLGDLGALLQQVETLGLSLLLLDLAAEMARDPRGTAQEIEALIGPEVREITSVLGQEAGFGRAA